MPFAVENLGSAAPPDFPRQHLTPRGCLDELKIPAVWRIVKLGSHWGIQMLRHIFRLSAFILFACSLVIAQMTLTSDKTTPPGAQASPQQPRPEIPGLEKRPPMNQATRMQIIQSINAEFARTRKYFPVGYKDIKLRPDGKINPDDARLYQLALTYGTAAKVGDRIQITNIVVHDSSIYLEINGGPKKKGHWYQHVTISGMGGAVSPGANEPNQAQPTGSAITLVFKNHVPEMTGPELKELLDPVFDFSLKTATEVYLETVPPKVKDAIKKHEVLVGMNHDMVVMSKERPPQKLREKDAKGVEYEEWIYGKPPQDVTFVRFVGDEVTQVKILKVNGEQVLQTEKEVDVKDGVVTLAAATAQAVHAASGEQQAPQQSGPPPTLKRPGEASDSQDSPRPQPMPRGGRPGDPTDPSGIPQGQPLPPVQPQPPSVPPPN